MPRSEPPSHSQKKPALTDGGGGCESATHGARPHAAPLPPAGLSRGGLCRRAAPLSTPRRLRSDGRGCGREAGAEARRTHSAEGSCRPGRGAPGGREQHPSPPPPGSLHGGVSQPSRKSSPSSLPPLSPARAGAAPSGARKRRGGGGCSGPAGGCGLPAAAAAPRVTAEDPLHLPPGCLHRRRSVCRGVSRTGEYRKAASGPGRSGEQRNPPPPTPQPSVGRVEARGEPAAPGPAGSGPPPCGAAGLRPLHGDAPRAVLPLSAPRLRARRGTRRPHGAAPRADAGRPERSFRAGDPTWALLAHPLVLFFFLFVLQTAPDGRSSAFHLEINEGREKRDLVFLR